VMLAGRRPASPDGCARWLPLWLPSSAAQNPLLSIEQNIEFRGRRSGDQPCSATSSPVRVCWRGGISHGTPRDRAGQADERAAAGMTSVRGTAAAWRSGVGYMAAGLLKVWA
jgi:hypothetical protein